jgi:hypothetical protein
VVVRGGFVYLAVGKDLQILNATSLQTVGAFTTQSVINAVDVVGTTAYVADSGSGLRIIDVSRPSQPSELGFLPTTNAVELTVANNTVYVADATGGVRIVNVADPRHPSQIQQLNSNVNTVDVGVSGNLLFAATKTGGLLSYNLANFLQLGVFPSPNGQQIRTLDVEGSVAYLGTQGGIFALDLSNPAVVTQMGQISFGLNPVTNIASFGDVLFASTGLTLRLVEASTPLATVVGGVLNVTGNALPNRVTIGVSGGVVSAVVDGGVQRFSLAGLTGIQINGGDSGDTIQVSSGLPGATVSGGKGADTINTGNGADMIFGGSAADSISAGAGADRVFGESGNDMLVGGNGADSLDGGAGNDSIQGNGGNDTLIGGTGNDTLAGGAGADSFFARDTFADTLFANRTEDILQIDRALDSVLA